MIWFLFAAVIALNSTANLLLKKASATAMWPPNALWAGAAVCFALNILVYGRVLKYLPITIAYPMLVGSTIAVVSMIALWRFGETVNLWHLAGFAFILLGVGILCWQAPNTKVEAPAAVQSE